MLGVLLDETVFGGRWLYAAGHQPFCFVFLFYIKSFDLTIDSPSAWRISLRVGDFCGDEIKLQSLRVILVYDWIKSDRVWSVLMVLHRSLFESRPALSRFSSSSQICMYFSLTGIKLFFPVWGTARSVLKKSILNREEEVMLDSIWWLRGDLVELALVRQKIFHQVNPINPRLLICKQERFWL